MSDQPPRIKRGTGWSFSISKKQLDRMGTRAVLELQRLMTASVRELKAMLQRQQSLDRSARRRAAERGLAVDLKRLAETTSGMVLRADLLERQLDRLEAEERARA